VPVLCALLGLVLVGIAYRASIAGLEGVEPIFWIGVLTIFAPAAIFLLRTDTSRTESITILLIAGLAIMGVKLLYGGGAFWGTLWAKGVDELMHYRTADDIVRTGRLFGSNPLLPISPLYPGLEIATNAVMAATGLDIVRAGIALVAFARALGVLALFLFLERVALPARLAALGSLIYMCAPTFLYQDSLYLYEALALALALACLFLLRRAQYADPELRHGLNFVGAVVVLAVVVTHHMTSFILVGTLVLWTLAELGLRWHRSRSTDRSRDDRSGGRFSWIGSPQTLPGAAWVPIVGILAVWYWLVAVATPTWEYVHPLLAHGVAEIIRIITLQEQGRRLFQSTGGRSASLLEQVVGMGSALITLYFIPFGMFYVWKRRRIEVLGVFLAVGALSYPAVLALRFTQSGWYAGSRAVAFVYVPLAFTVAAGIEQIVRMRTRPSRLRRGLLSATIFALMLVMFAGGLIAGNGPVMRLPKAYDPAVSALPTDAESIAAATWARETLGPDHRLATDWPNTVLMGSYGRQEALTASQDVPVESLFVTSKFGTAEIGIVERGRIQYVVVDRRIIGKLPIKGFIYEPWKSMVSDYRLTVLNGSTIGKFDRVPKASRVFDSGNLQFYDLQEITR